MQKITPFLWFDSQAEEAMHFYLSIFKNGKVLYVAPGPNGKAMMVSFELEGQVFMALNAGPHDKFNEAISFYVNCVSQEEVDELWNKLSARGETSQCGWLKDKFGISWQIIPNILSEYLGDKDPEKAGKVMQSMLTMTKIDIAQLKEAYEGK